MINMRQKGSQFSLGVVGMVILAGALAAFEVANFASTEFALKTFWGDMSFMGISWATLFAIAFCAADFGGMARAFTPEKGIKREPTWVIGLLVAWLLSGVVNAAFTGWGTLVAMLQNGTQGNPLVSTETLYKLVPAAMALAMFLARVGLVWMFAHVIDMGKISLPKPVQPAEAKKDDKVPMPLGNSAPSLPPLQRPGTPQGQPQHQGQQGQNNRPFGPFGKK